MCPFIWCVFYDTLHTTCIPTCTPAHLRSNLTFGAILPRIIEQVPCPRYSTFLSLFITFIYRCSRDLCSALYPFIWCVVYDTLHTACIPACIPAHLRSYLTFGTILPRILEQVPCPRYSTFILFFITFHFIPFHSISFHFIPYLDVREIYRLFTVTFLSFLG